MYLLPSAKAHPAIECCKASAGGTELAWAESLALHLTSCCNLHRCLGLRQGNILLCILIFVLLILLLLLAFRILLVLSLLLASCLRLLLTLLAALA